MKVDEKQLAAGITEVMKTGGGTVPEWAKTIENIVKGVNDMLGTYQTITGKKPPPQNQEPPMDWATARDLKKLEMSGKETIVPESEFKEILAGIIKSCASLEQMGYGDKSIGEAINSLPFTIKQTKAFLTKLYQSKYGG